MLKVISKWKKATQQNLTNTSRNRQAWLGQASCCYNHQAPEYVTKLAWRSLPKKEQNKANQTADKIINLWQKTYKRFSTVTYDWETYQKKLQELQKIEGKQVKLTQCLKKT